MGGHFGRSAVVSVNDGESLWFIGGRVVSACLPFDDFRVGHVTITLHMLFPQRMNIFCVFQIITYHPITSKESKNSPCQHHTSLKRVQMLLNISGLCSIFIQCIANGGFVNLLYSEFSSKSWRSHGELLQG